MKLPSRILATLIFALGSLAAFAAQPVKYFEELSGKQRHGLYYNYISPTMLKMLGDNSLSSASKNNKYSNLPVQCSDLTSLENILYESGADEELWDIIHKIKKEHKMETLVTKKSQDYRKDVLVNLSKDGSKILNLLVISQRGDGMVNVIYMEGKIPVESIRSAYY